MGEAQLKLLPEQGRLPFSRALLSQRQLFWLWVALGCGVLITVAPILQRNSRGTAPHACATRAAFMPECPAAPAPSAPAPRRLELPWPPLLTPEEQRRGISYYGSGGALDRVARKLLAGQPIKAYALGGSVTGGGGASDMLRRGYVGMFFRFIRRNFPNKGHVLENKGIAASTAFMYATCLQHHVPEDADLVTLEFSVNESPDLPFTSTDRRSFEHLIRRLLARPNPPAVLLLHHWGWWNSGGDGIDRGLFYFRPESDLTLFSNYYDIPTLSLRSAAWHLMHAGVDGFQVHGVFSNESLHNFLNDEGQAVLGTIPAAPQADVKNIFFFDATHPLDTGHQVLAELLAAALSRAVWEASSDSALTEADRRRDNRLPRMPPPMIPFNADSIPGMCAMLEEFEPIVKNHSGFEYKPERPKAKSFMRQKWGWRSEEPGSWAELEVDSEANDTSAAADTLVWLSHLRSYAGMGTARIECVSGCTCNATRLDGTWERRASLFTITRFHVTRHKQCRFRVTVLEDPGEVPQKGHKVVLVAVMVTHIPLDKSGSLKAVQNIGLSHDMGF